MTLNNLKQKEKINFFTDGLEKDESSILTGEVFDIILNDKHVQYVNDLSIGSIQFRMLSGKLVNANLFTAYPLNPYIKFYPIKHEIVVIIKAPISSSSTSANSVGYYYTTAVNVWRLINHNALPYSSLPVEYNNKSKSENYSNFTGNLVQENNINFGEYFIESINRPDLLPFEGDNIIQGRWGNSIRFSGTFDNLNPWSSKGNVGDPIIIIRNDGSNVINKKYIVEDINKDESSIYVCNGQLIPLEPAYFNLKSFTTNPKSSLNYNDSQIILNSNRLFFNAKKDSIFLSALESISLSSANTINIDFKTEMVIGDTHKAERTILGESLMKILNAITIPSPLGPLKLNTSQLLPPVNIGGNMYSNWATLYSTKSVLSSKVRIE